MAKKSRSKGRRAAAPESKVPKPKALRSKGPQRDSEGPLGWLAPDLESAYTRLRRRGEPAAAPGAETKSRSTLSSGRTALHEVNRSIWRDLLTQYKSRKVEAARTRALAPAPMVPGGRNWLPLGPTLVLNGQTVGQEPVGGRVAGLAVAPGGEVLYAASANGGVFKSEDGATSWRSMMDRFDLDPTNFGSASVVCGAIAIDPADPHRVYVGTGEGDTDLMFRENFRVINALPAYRGVGPLRSDDGGVNWIPEDSQPDLVGESFFALAVDPGNRENVVAATTNGLYRRVPATGGKFRWEQKRAGIYSSVVVASAGGTTRFLAAEWGKGVVRSIDGGDTWSSISSGFPSTGIGRIALAVQADNPSPAYALVAKNSGGVQGLFRLEATGGWKNVSSVPNILRGRQGDYDLSISISPGDPDTIYIAGDRINVFPFSAMIARCRIQASGAAFKVKTATSIGTHAHADVHSLVHTPGDPTELWCTCDGGVYLNRNPKGTGQFVSQNSGLACLCTNFLAQHPTDPNILLAGLQDNGTARTTAGPVWTHVQHGDGGYCLVNWADPSLVLVFMGGGVFRSTDGGATFPVDPVLAPASGTMTFPVVSPPFNPASPADAKLVAVGAAETVFMSNNFGSSFPAGQQVFLPTNAGSIFALAFASTTRLFIGTTNGSVFRADRSGNTWTATRLDNAATGPLELEGLITDVAVDWADATGASVYVCFGGQGDDRRRVWHYDGTRWQARSGPAAAKHLLNVEHNALAVDPAAPANVYVGADIGVWHSADRGLTWQPLENGLPDAPVYDLQIHPTQRLLRAATHGRGVYELPL